MDDKLYGKVKKISIQATIGAPIDVVWNKYTSDEHIVNWNAASDEWHTPTAHTDLREGGELNWRMEAKDGSFGFDFEAKFIKIEPLTYLKYRLLDYREVEVYFKQIEQGTEVKTIFDPESQNPVEMQQAGWQAILDRFKNYCEKE